MKKTSISYKSAFAAVTAASLLFTSGQFTTVQAADHRDAPAIDEDPRVDLLDFYAFTNPNNTNKVILVMTVNPFEEGGAPAVAFSPHALYQFKIDNTGDYKEDLVIQATFTEAIPGPQIATIIGPSPVKAKTIVSTIVKVSKKTPNDRFSGPANNVISNTTGTVRAFAGPRDDPFFFDLLFVFRALGFNVPPGTRGAGIDFFAGFNCSALIVEVDSSSLKGTAAMGNRINAWATTSRSASTSRSAKLGKPDKNSTSYVQVERMGKPALNTVLIKGARKDDYNLGTPSTDIANFRAEALPVLVSLNHDTNYSLAVLELLMPDVLTLNMGSTIGYEYATPTGGLPQLNGRLLTDDVIDTTLRAALLNDAATDEVDHNDVPFLDDFPFLAAPHSAKEAVPARDHD